MLAPHSTTTAPDISGPSTLAHWVHALWKRAAGWRRRRRAIAELHWLGDRSLADIGIERSKIEAIINTGSRDASRHTR